MAQGTHGGHHSSGHAAEHEEHHIIPLATYVKVLAALLVLTVITVAASRFDFGAMNTVINIGIASVKASLVLAIFMHLKYDDKLYLVVFLTGVFFLIVMYFFSVLDLFTRIPVSPIL
jgi:cytochrome c oxidase subunit 4